MLKNLLFTTVMLSGFLFTSAAESPQWGSTGHRTIGEIAESHLSHKAKKAIEKLLNGEGLAWVSTFGDEIKSDKRYDKFYSWHFVNFPFDQSYEASKKNPEGDIIKGINHCIEVIRNPASSETDKVFYLKFLVHLIGDLHQPMHIGLEADRGGNDIKVKWHYRDSNLHRVWDSNMIDSWNMSYTELASNARTLSKEQIRSLEKGSALDWANETRELTKRVYGSAKPGENLGYRYSYEHFELLRKQLHKSGIRLAKVLNELFG